MYRWQLSVAYQASFLGQFDKYIRGLVSSESSNEPGLCWNYSNQWEKSFFHGVYVDCNKTMRRLPFVIRCMDLDPNGLCNSKLFEALHSAAEMSTKPADDFFILNLFVREALEQCECLFAYVESLAVSDIGAAESGLLIKLMHSLGHLLGLSLSFGLESYISLPKFYENIMVGALSSTDGKTALISAMVRCK